jgi:type I restriction-modification system DNA methylase subunit
MYFDEVLKIDYETLYTTDFIDIIAFPDDDVLVKQIKELVSILNRYNFGTLGYDILGRIFERLIPQDERHTLGQYFTSADVVDLILLFCSQNENDKLLDPSCGAGTFLVRGYQQKKLMNQHKKHEEILDKLWGNDIAKFPAHLSTINLAIKDLGVLKNYPNILQSDFFALQVGPHGFDNDNWRKRRAKTLGIDEREVTYPRYFDAIVGNPPYTRQEEIKDTGVDKQQLIDNALMFGNKKIANISKRAGIYAYFFVHGWKFLKEGGYFGFIVSYSWMDVDYGKGLQEFFLRNYKIIAIIDSEAERWFKDADINTCIVILKKCSNEKERNENLVRFVMFKKNIADIYSCR